MTVAEASASAICFGDVKAIKLGSDKVKDYTTGDNGQVHAAKKPIL